MLETEYRVPGCNAMTAAILKIVFLCISQRFIVRSTPNLVWRSRITFRHRSQTKIPNFEKSKWRTAAMLKMVLSSYLSRESSDFNETWWMDTNFDSKNGHVTKYQNFPNSERRTAAMLKAAFLDISQPFIVRLTRSFVRRSTITLRHRSCDHSTKFRKFKMADGRQFQNGFITISQPEITRLRWNLVHGGKFWFSVTWQNVKIPNFEN